MLTESEKSTLIKEFQNTEKLINGLRKQIKSLEAENLRQNKKLNSQIQTLSKSNEKLNNRINTLESELTELKNWLRTKKKG